MEIPVEEGDAPMRNKRCPVVATLAACALVLAGVVRMQADTPRQTALNAAAQAQKAVDAARRAHAEAEKARANERGRGNTSEVLDKKIEAEKKTLAEAQAALKAAQQAVAAIPEGQDLTTRKKVGEQLDELDAVLKVLDLIENLGLDLFVAAVDPSDSDAKKRAQEVVNEAVDEVEKAINKLPPEKRKNLQRQLEDRQKELLGQLALGAQPGKANNTKASLASAGKTTSKDGLQTVAFDSPAGQIKVSMTNDQIAGGTFSGTVVAEAAGKTREERERNTGELNGQVISVANTSGPVGKTVLTWTIPAGLKGLEIVLRDRSGKVVGRTEVPYQKTPMKPRPPAKPGEATFKLPTIGQEGRTLHVEGPFDGKLDTTSITIGGHEVETIAESPNQVVFRARDFARGRTEIVVREGDLEAKSEYRNVSVNLTASSTTITKGQTLDVKAEFTGLEGITENVLVTIYVVGPVRVPGGSSQTRRISPNQVKAGKYEMILPLTGQRPGAFSVTTTVVTKERVQATRRSAGPLFKEEAKKPASAEERTVDGDFLRDYKSAGLRERSRIEQIIDLFEGKNPSIKFVNFEGKEVTWNPCVAPNVIKKVIRKYYVNDDGSKSYNSAAPPESSQIWMENHSPERGTRTGEEVYWICAKP